MLPPHVFREYDIRALYGKELHDHDAHMLGQAFGTLVHSTGNRHVVVARDGRLSSPALAHQLIEGLKATGINVTHVGVGPSPYLYYCEKQLKPGGAIMITASHNPKEYNGFKIIFQGKSFFGADLQDLKALMDTGVFEKGAGHVEEQSFHDRYRCRLQTELNHYSSQKPIKAVWDPGNGAASHLITELVKTLPGDHTLINGILDGNFPNRGPDPSRPENCTQLLKAMQECKADVGFAFDGDGDRLVVMDHTGYLLSGDELLLLFAQEVLHHNPGAKVIADPKVSQNFWNMVSQWGGTGLMGRTGHSFIKSLMHETQALLAGEVSGHFFFSDRYEGYDDGLYAAIRTLGILWQQTASLQTWRQQFPVFYISPEYRLECHNKFAIIHSVKEKLEHHHISYSTLDGIRVTTPHGWWLLRASNTQEALSLRFESPTPEGLEALRAQINQYLSPDLEIPKP